METGETVTPAGSPVAAILTVLAKPALPAIENDTVPDPPAVTLTLATLALTVKLGAGAGVLLLEPEPPHPRMNRVQKRATDTTKLQVEQWARIVWPLQDRACSGGNASISQRQNLR